MTPEGTLLGPLAIVEVYEYYDGPRLFLATNNAGQQFIALWADFDDESDTWLYAPISSVRLHYLTSGELELREAFLANELEFVWNVKYTHATHAWIVTAMKVERLTQRLLPEEGIRLRREQRVEIPPQATEHNLSALARGSKRDALLLALQYGRKYKHEAPARELGEFLEAFQENLDVLGQARRGKFGRGGAVLPEVLEQTEMLVEATYPSSFGMRLIAAMPSDLTGQSLAADALTDFVELLASDDEHLKAVLADRSFRVAAKYRKLLTSLVDTEAGLRLVWQRPTNETPVRIDFPLNRARAVFDIVCAVKNEEMEKIFIEGVLTSASITNRTYEIMTPKGRYAGKVLPEARADLAGATLSMSYRAELHVFIEVATATGVEKTQYFLASLKRL